MFTQAEPIRSCHGCRTGPGLEYRPLHYLWKAIRLSVEFDACIQTSNNPLYCACTQRMVVHSTWFSTQRHQWGQLTWSMCLQQGVWVCIDYYCLNAFMCISSLYSHPLLQQCPLLLSHPPLNVQLLTRCQKLMLTFQTPYEYNNYSLEWWPALFKLHIWSTSWLFTSRLRCVRNHGSQLHELQLPGYLHGGERWRLGSCWLQWLETDGEKHVEHENKFTQEKCYCLDTHVLIHSHGYCNLVSL